MAEEKTKKEQILEAIDDMILNQSTSQFQSYKIGNRELVKHSLTELVALRKLFSQQVADEKADAQGSSRFVTHVVELC